MKEIRLLESLTRSKVILSEASIEDLKDKPIIRVSNQLVTSKMVPTFIEKFINFDVNKDTLTKADYARIQEALKNVSYASTPGLKTVRDVAAEYNMSVAEFCSKFGTKVPLKLSPGELERVKQMGGDGMTTIMNMINWGEKIPKSYIPLMNSLEKEIYDSQNIPNPDAELKALVAAKLKAMKDCIVARVSAADTKAAAQTALKGRINPQFKKAIDEIAESFRLIIKEDTKGHLNQLVKEWKDKFPSGTASFEEYKSAFSKTIMGGGSRSYSRIEDPEISNYGLIKRDGSTYSLVSDLNNVIEQKAEANSQEQIAEFTSKMYDKLGGFLTDLGQDFNVTYSGSKSFNEITFIFSGGARFSIRNKIVRKSRYNPGAGGYTFYYQYPTTFHDAYLSDGTKIASPSEAQIKQAFTK